MADGEDGAESNHTRSLVFYFSSTFVVWIRTWLFIASGEKTDVKSNTITEPGQFFRRGGCEMIRTLWKYAQWSKACAGSKRGRLDDLWKTKKATTTKKKSCDLHSFADSKERRKKKKKKKKSQTAAWATFRSADAAEGRGGRNINK